MSGRRIYVSSPSSDSKRNAGQIERPSSRTDQLVEASFSSDMSPNREISPSKPSNAFSEMPSISKLKEVLAKTSEKLSVYTGKHEISSFYPDISEKTREISELKQRIRVLETEK